MQQVDLHDVLRRYIAQSNNPDMAVYGRETLEHPDRAIRVIRHWMKLGRMYNARVLDIGCGFGWQALVIALDGNNTVIGNDVRRSMTQAIEQRIADLAGQGISAKVQTLTGDICSADLPDNSFDAMLCNQTMEHVHDLPAMFRAVHRLLRPGGIGVFINDNNVLNPACATENRQMWAKRDQSWEYIEELKKKRPIENADIEPYAVMRLKIVGAARPDLSDADAQAIAAATAGLTRPEIEGVARVFKPGAALPRPPELSWCRNPETGEYCERLLDPHAVAEMARSAGLDASIRHHFFTRFPYRILNAFHFDALNRWLFKRLPTFTIVVTKPR